MRPICWSTNESKQAEAEFVNERKDDRQPQDLSLNTQGDETGSEI